MDPDSELDNGQISGNTRTYNPLGQPKDNDYDSGASTQTFNPLGQPKDNDYD